MTSESDELRELVFVHGRMRRGGSLASRLADAEFVAEGVSQGNLYEISQCSAFVPDETGSFVTGDLFMVDRKLLEELGDVEIADAGLGEGGMVRLTRVKVHPNNPGQQAWDARAWVWVRPLTGGVRIDSGDWLEWLRVKPAPWCTGIAMLCLLGFPLALASPVLLTYYGSRALSHTGIGILSLLSPPAGLFAAWMGSKRFEKWAGIRGILMVLLAMASIPAVFGVVGMVVMAVRAFLP